MRKQRILVVDDDAFQRVVLENFLAVNGFEVRLAADGPQALRMIPTFRPDLVVLDVMMPKVNGYRVSRMLKTLVKHTEIRVPKVLLLTARRVNSVRSQELLEFSKADNMMFKPYQPATLIATIEALLAGVAVHPSAA
jgi:CheY-like chemotaxis protein